MKIETGKGLGVSSSFIQKFGDKDIKPALTVPAFKTLPRNMYDKEIQSELGAEECTLEDVAAFLKNPPEGCDDGNWNIFYVAGCVVCVIWHSGVRGWLVRAWRLDVGYWNAGSRAFGATATQKLSPDLTLSPSDTLTLSDIEVRLAAVEAMLKHHKLGV